MLWRARKDKLDVICRIKATYEKSCKDLYQQARLLICGTVQIM